MAQKRKSNGGDGDLFIEGSGQLRLVDESAEQQALEKGKVECLGMTFDSEDARRAYFTERLQEKLADPEFRKATGFPKGADDDIVRMSDPPWYTACPNPFLTDFVRVYGKPYDPKERYERDPFAVDTSVGKTDALYKAHGYHTKVPHLAIVPSILHYTEPGDIVLDGFSGSGMTGVAAQWCGSAPAEYRKQLETEWSKRGLPKPKWGARRAMLNDLGPAATFISANYALPFSSKKFEFAANRIMRDFENALGWMYETRHQDGNVKGRINYTVWSQVFSCPECSSEVVFLEEAFDKHSKRVREEFNCANCKTLLSKGLLDKRFETRADPATGETWSRIKLKPVIINYTVGKYNFEKAPDANDIEILTRISDLPFPGKAPTTAFPFDEMWEAPRLKAKGVTMIHHLFVDRALQTLSYLWGRVQAVDDPELRRNLAFSFEQGIRNFSILNAFEPLAYSQNARGQKGAFYIFN